MERIPIDHTIVFYADTLVILAFWLDVVEALPCFTTYGASLIHSLACLLGSGRRKYTYLYIFLLYYFTNVSVGTRHLGLGGEHTDCLADYTNGDWNKYFYMVGENGMEWAG